MSAHRRAHPRCAPNRIIRLEAKDTKTAEPRVVFLCDQAYDILGTVDKISLLEHNYLIFHAEVRGSLVGPPDFKSGVPSE